MTIKEISARITTLKITEQRTLDDAYGELVLLNTQIQELNSILIEILGPPSKKQGAKPDKEMLVLTKNYGGIWNDQILFKKNFDTHIILAMLWPWQDGIHTTLKLALIK